MKARNSSRFSLPPNPPPLPPSQRSFAGQLAACLRATSAAWPARSGPAPGPSSTELQGPRPDRDQALQPGEAALHWGPAPQPACPRPAETMPAMVAPGAEPSLSLLMEQLVSAFQLGRRGGDRTLRLELRPWEDQDLAVELCESHRGLQITLRHSESGRKLDGLVQRLKQELTARGLGYDAIEVDVL